MRSIGVCLALVAVMGCGGGGNDAAPAEVSPFAGYYSGTWEMQMSPPGHVERGRMIGTIGSDGAINAMIHNDTSSVFNGTLVGTIATDGQFTGTAQYPHYLPEPVHGVLTLTDTGATGWYMETIEGVEYSASMILVRQ